MNSEDLLVIVTQALEAMKEEAGDAFDIEKVNLAELGRRTGLSRSKLRTLKKKGFKSAVHGNTGKARPRGEGVLAGHEGQIDAFLSRGVSNSRTVFEELRKSGYGGSLSTVKRYIGSHKDLMPAPRILVSPQGSRGQRYETRPGAMFQMDWGFVTVHKSDGEKTRYACLVMVCHHCGFRHFEFFCSASQENLFIGMIHAFEVMGLPETVLTDNMASVARGRDAQGHPRWNKEYDEFQKLAGFETRLCKVAHPFTKGAVERCVRYIKTSFIPGRTARNLSDLNGQALSWCREKNALPVRGKGTVPAERHPSEPLRAFALSPELMPYRAPARKISFDGYVSYEGRSYGVPYSYQRSLVRVLRDGDDLLILDPETFRPIVRHAVDWSRPVTPCKNQWALPAKPEERPTSPVRSCMSISDENAEDDRFARFKL